MQMRNAHAASMLLALLIPASAVGSAPRSRNVGTQSLYLDAAQLHAGLEARRLLVREDGLVIDQRSQTSPPTPARLTTDVLDLGGTTVLSTPIDILRVDATVESNTSVGDRVDLEMRSGTTFFQHANTWSNWRAMRPQQPRGRYVQFRVTAASDRQEFRVKGLRVDRVLATDRPTFETGLTLAGQQVQRIVASPIPFAYQRPDHPDLRWLRHTFPLDKVTASGKTEMERVNALCTWVSSRRNDRHRGWNALDYYPWNVRRLIHDEQGGVIYGHCASYCSVFLACCQALGWQGRHWAVEGYKENCHEIAEIYINELGRWIYFDPSLATYYVDRTTGRPLDVLQMHDIYLDTHFGRPGDTVPAVERNYEELDRRRKMIDWKAFPGQPVSDGWIYGRKGAWDWTKAQGILTTAWLQMTPRNNFYDQPRPVYRQFGWGPTGNNGFPMWVDARTPPRTTATHNFATRRRDFYWTLNQASLRMVRTGERTIAVELGNRSNVLQHI